ncbi:TPA: methionine--tRNA ligase [Candidatus Woesearchaeota archaeon]|nr:methionine--tRNA ligase [Candidatus Woesearchaeota archaeon]
MVNFVKTKAANVDKKNKSNNTTSKNNLTSNDKKNPITDKKRILVTSALPYANGSIHCGHLVEYIQTDIFVRFNRLIGEDAIYICADDTHGAPIEINASKQGITPEQLIAKYYDEHTKDFKDFQIQFDSYYSTNSPENKYYSDLIFERLNKKGLIYKKPVKQTYCNRCNRFLPDRYVRGECPKCHAQEQYGDVCEICSSTHSTTELINPHCSICKTPAVQKESVHYFFKLSELSEKLKDWLNDNKRLQPEIVNYIQNWIKEGLNDWDISRDGPYFGFKIPGEEDKYYYVWLDAPIGYIASTQNYCNLHKQYGLSADDYWQRKEGSNDVEIIHVIGKDIIYFHFLFWPAVLLSADFNLPNYLVVHGFLTVNGEKMSKSRGTFFTAKEFLEKYKAEHLRFYYATTLSRKLVDVDLNFKDLHDKINNELVGNLSNFCYRSLSFLEKNFEGRFKELDDSEEGKKLIADVTSKYGQIKKSYLDFNYRDALSLILEVSAIGNRYLQQKEPWKLVKGTSAEKETAQKILATAANLAKDLSILLSPVLPKLCEELQAQLNLGQLTWDDLGFDLKNHKINAAKILASKIEFEPQIIEKKEEAVEDVKFTVTKDTVTAGIKVRVAQLTIDKIKNKHEGLERLKDQLKNEIDKYTGNDKNAKQKKIIEDYNSIDKKSGVDVAKHPNSVVNLINLIKEKGKLPQINTVVDAYNVASLKHLVSMATHDIAKIEGSIVVRKAKLEDNFVSIDGTSDVIGKNEIVYSDDKKVLGRFSKQCLATKTTHASKNIVLICFGNNKISDAEMDAAVKKACELIVKFNGGKYKILGKATETKNKKEEKIKETKEIHTSSNLFPLNPKVVKIIEVKVHPNADKLYLLKLDTGTEIKQIVAGIRKWYKPEELLDRKIVYLSNLKPAKIRGEVSNGMVLGADHDDKYILFDPTEDSQVGDEVFAEGFENNTQEIEFEDAAKVTDNLEITNKKILFNSKPLRTKSCEVKVDAADGAKVR